MNKYDDPAFFDQYKEMERSKNGLTSAGEWHELKKMLPDFKDKKVLDLGCGYGWHCIYAAENGATLVKGIDSSERMLEVARQKTTSQAITYEAVSMEEFPSTADSFDIVISSLALHYVESFEDICIKVKQCLVAGGSFVFSVENPIFTAYGTGDWYRDTDGNIVHWPVDHYFSEGKRETTFLGCQVTKYHKTLATYINTLVQHGFSITKVVEPMPEGDLLDKWPDELRRPMMLLISAKNGSK